MKENEHSYDYGWSDGYVTGNNIDNNSPGSINAYTSIIKKSEYSRLYNLLNFLNGNFNEILEEEDVKKIYLFEPGIGSENVGDQIIIDSIKKEMCELFAPSFCIELPTHTPLSNRYMYFLGKPDYRFLFQMA